MELYFTFPNWKRKAFSFTYDDGTVHDYKMVETLNRFGLRGTFNLVPSWLGQEDFVKKADVASLYQGHEIASHGYRHLHLNDLAPAQLRAELRDGRAALEDLLGKPVRGFASPYGQAGHKAVKTMRELGFAYCRSTAMAGKTTLVPRDWLDWAPTAWHGDKELFEKIEAYFASPGWGGTMTAFRLFGHSYEFKDADNWDLLERICERVAHREDLWYATDIEIHDYFKAIDEVRITMNGHVVENLSAIPLYAHWGRHHGTTDVKNIVLRPGELVDLDAYDPEKPSAIEVRDRSVPANAKPWGGKDRFQLAYPGWKQKALTFSYDDGCEADRHLLDILNKHGMKGTFNLNSEYMAEGIPANAKRSDLGFILYPATKKELTTLYKGHEIAVHGARHDTYNSVPYPVVVDDVYTNRLELERISGRPVRGMAYPNGNGSKCPRVDMILRSLGIVYSRVTPTDPSFALPAQWLDWHPTAHHNDNIAEIGKAFLAKKVRGEPLLCYIWGHAFELDGRKNWNVMEEFCDLMANKPEIWYATNIEIYEYVHAARSLHWSLDGHSVENPTPFPIYGFEDGEPCVIPPGAK